MLISRTLQGSSPQSQHRSQHKSNLAVVTKNDHHGSTMKPKTILMLVVVVSAVVAGVLLGVPKFNGWQFQDDVSAVAKFESARTDEDIRALVMKKAKDHDVDIKPEDIMISRDNNM